MRFETFLNHEKTKEFFGYYPVGLSKGSNKKVVCECSSCKKLIIRAYKNHKDKHQCSIVRKGSKRCFKCMTWKKFSFFASSSKLSGKVSKTCKECFRNYPCVVKYEKNRSIKLSSSLDSGDIKFYLKRKTPCIKSSAKRKKIPYNLDYKYLLELWNKQNGICYYTGLPMCNTMKQKDFQAWDCPSVDKLDPQKGYTKGNVVWCINAVNSFKQTLNESQFIEILKKIKWKE